MKTRVAKLLFCQCLSLSLPLGLSSVVLSCAGSETAAAALPTSAVVCQDQESKEADQEQEADQEDEGFVSLFDGKTLAGWRGLKDFWSIEDGAITGQTTAEKPLTGNTFLIWEKDEVKDFELKLKFRLTEGNSGIQYRSQDLGDNVVGGYQADIDFGKQWIGILYDERGRGILATRMQSVLIKQDGEKEVTALEGDEAAFLEKYDPDQWNTYHVIANGNRLTHKVNGVTTIEIVDQQSSEAETSGVLALQLHTGPAMKVQFKDLKLKVLNQETAEK